MPTNTGVYLGIDVGTSSLSAVLIDAEGTVLARGRQPLTTVRPGLGQVEHDPEQWWTALRTVVGVLLKQAPDADGHLRGIGVSGMGPCVVPVSRSGRPLGPAILYGVDSRATAQIDDLEARLGVHVIRQRCDNDLTSQSAGPKIAWLRDHEPHTYEAARWFLTSHSALVLRLTGHAVTDHLTASYFHPLYNARTQRWDVGGLEDIVAADRLPRLAWPGEQAGRLTSQVARELGLPAGLPVAVGTADAPAEALASGVVTGGKMMIMYGSSGFVIAPTEARVVRPGLYSAPGLAPGTWMVAAGTSTAGAFLQWWQRVLCNHLDDDTAQRVALLDLAASSQPGARGVTVLPHLSGERSPWNDPHARGVVADLTGDHTAADLARAGVEGVAASMVLAIESVREAIRDSVTPLPTSAAATGGGAMNPIWVQTVSTMADLTQQVRHAADGASLGAAFLGCMAAGDATHPEQITRWHSEQRFVHPISSQQEALQAVLHRHRSTYEAMHRRTT